MRSSLSFYAVIIKLYICLISFKLSTSVINLVQGRRSSHNHINEQHHQSFKTTNYTLAQRQAELRSLGLNVIDFRMHYNIKYEFYFFTNLRYNGPHGSVDHLGMMMKQETDFAVDRIKLGMLKNNGTCNVIDVGSNFGYFSLLSMSLGCRVFAFEPEKNNFDLSIINFHINRFKNFKAYNNPVGQTPVLFDGWSSMNINSKNKSATSYVESVPISTIRQFMSSNKVDARADDKDAMSHPARISNDHNIGKSNSTDNPIITESKIDRKNPGGPIIIDWFKLDVEGFENEVIKTVPNDFQISSLSIEITYFLVEDISYKETFEMIHNRFSNVLDIDNGKRIANLTAHTIMLNNTRCARPGCHYCQYNILCSV
jgi:FkbM family methyltransferase